MSQNLSIETVSYERVASLPTGVVDVTKIGTYTSTGLIPRDRFGSIDLERINHGHRQFTGRELYHSLQIRLTGGFDD